MREFMLWLKDPRGWNPRAFSDLANSSAVSLKIKGTPGLSLLVRKTESG